VVVEGIIMVEDLVGLLAEVDSPVVEEVSQEVEEVSLVEEHQEVFKKEDFFLFLICGIIQLALRV
jgi:hypothetical protein